MTRKNAARLERYVGTRSAETPKSQFWPSPVDPLRSRRPDSDLMPGAFPCGCRCEGPARFTAPDGSLVALPGHVVVKLCATHLGNACRVAPNPTIEILSVDVDSGDVESGDGMPVHVAIHLKRDGADEVWRIAHSAAKAVLTMLRNAVADATLKAHRIEARR